MATNKKSYKKPNRFAVKEGHMLIRSIGVTQPIIEHINRLLSGEPIHVDVEGHHIYLHRTNPNVWQHVGSGLLSIIRFIEVWGARHNKAVSVSGMLGLVDTLLNKKELDEDLLLNALSDLNKATAIMASLKVNESHDIVQTLKFINLDKQQEVLQGKIKDFPQSVVLG